MNPATRVRLKRERGTHRLRFQGQVVPLDPIPLLGRITTGGD